MLINPVREAQKNFLLEQLNAVAAIVGRYLGDIKNAFTVMQAMNTAGIIATRESRLPGTQYSADIWVINLPPTYPNDQYFLIDVTICQAY